MCIKIANTIIFSLNRWILGIILELSYYARLPYVIFIPRVILHTFSSTLLINGDLGFLGWGIGLGFWGLGFQLTGLGLVVWGFWVLWSWGSLYKHKTMNLVKMVPLIRPTPRL